MKQTLWFIEFLIVLNGLFEANNNNDNNNIISLSIPLLFTNHFATYNSLIITTISPGVEKKCIFPLYKKIN